MARTSATSIDNTFIQGLITDHTALNFPENACTDCNNVIFEPTGRVIRRRGFKYENDYDTVTIDRTNKVIRSFLWREVNGLGAINIFVVQVGQELYFYLASSGSISGARIPQVIDLADHEVVDSDETLGSFYCEFAYGKGVLFVTHPRCEPFYVSYAGFTLTDHEIDIKIRDLGGAVWPGMPDFNTRPTESVSSADAGYLYNLKNQGWVGSGGGASALTDWDTARSDLPSASDVWWYYKDEEDTFDEELVAKRDPGTSLAPRGHYIVDAFNIDRQTVSGITPGNGDETLETQSTDPYRPSCVAFFAGRVWYAGAETDRAINKLYFTQVIEDDLAFGKCYQKNDPTSEIKFDLLPTDGGVIELSGSGIIYKLLPMGNALMVFTSSGIWAIAGSEGIGFVANDFSVNKISAIEVNSAQSFVSVDGQPYWWSDESINTIITQDNLTWQVKSISDFKIRRLLMEIPLLSKRHLRGDYDPTSRTIQWAFRSAEDPTITKTQDFDRILQYNILTESFSIWSLPSSYPVHIHSVQSFKGFTGEVEAVIVVDDNEDVVVDSDENEVAIYNLTGNTAVPVFKYVVSAYDEETDEYKFTIAEAENIQYVDWVEYDDVGASFESTFTTAYMLSTDTQRFFQPNYVFVFLEDVAQQSSCYVQGVFDYSINQNTGKWSSKQQVYNHLLTGRGVNFRRLKMRGKGRVLQLRFTADQQKPFTILGWSIFQTANQEL